MFEQPTQFDADFGETRHALAERPAWSRVGWKDSRVPTPCPRRMLWIDRVGAYLICPAEKVVLGRAFGETGRVDVPILADLELKHANIRRHGDVYLLEPASEVRVAGRVVRSAEVLREGTEFDLVRGNSSVRMRFSRPHPWSASARLDFVTRHHAAPRCDAVLLLADTLILGPGPASHVSCRGWPREVMLVRQQERLNVSLNASYEVDSRAVEGAVLLGQRSRVRGPEWSFAVEMLAAEGSQKAPAPAPVYQN